nr:ribonuclease H-like domain-containing protein [Tanacetum cinerariifolium]
MSYLSNFEELNGGYVSFGGNPKGGKIYGKGKIKTCKLDFDDVYFVKELKFNLFCISQMCDRKNSVLFTDTGCLVLSPDFKLPNESQVPLRVLRENNMYNVNLKNIIPSRDLTCLFANVSIDESNLWHRRLGHINFKTINKLVKGNLVRGLPIKVFENKNTCVACKKGKQHKASCKTKSVSSVDQPLFRLHMDLFGPTFVKSLNKKSYCLVITDDYSRFTWVFLLATKDETSPILKTFITGLENQLSLKMKVIKSDNRIEFKNNDLNQFCGMKGIKREFSVPRTPQQNGIAERKNKTLIEAARTMLADSLLPIPFWAKAVNTACYNNDEDAAFDVKEHDFDIKKPESKVNVSSSSSTQSRKQDDKTKKKAKGKSPVESFTRYKYLNAEFEDCSANSSNEVNVADASQLPDDLDMPELEDITYSNDEDVVSAEADFNNLESSIPEEPKRKVWVLVGLPHKKRAIGTKWVYKNKKDERGIVIRNKTRLVAQGHTQEEGIDYKEVFAPVARIEAIRLFLAYASFIGFMVYQMDVKSAFLYGTIEEEVYVCQPLGFEDPNHPDKVYKVVKALYGLHQAPKAWYKTLATYLLENGFQRGTIDQTLFIKKQKGDILLVQIYVDDIIFVKQKKDRIFISQDKYVAEILRKSGLTEGKSASTPIYTEKPLLKDPDGEDVDVHTYRSMISSLMYLTSSRPDIMFAVCACARFQVTPKASHLHACKKQTFVATSSTEAEYVAAASCYAQVLWIQNQPLDYGHKLLLFSLTNSCCSLSAVRSSIAIKQDNDITRLQALVDKKKVVVTEAAIREVLWLDDAEGVHHTLPQLPQVQQPSSPPQAQQQVADFPMSILQEALDACAALTKRVEQLKLKRVRTSQRIDTSDNTVMDDASNQGRIIDELDKDDAVALMDDKEDDKEEEEAKVVENDQVHGRQAESQTEIYKINMDHASKVLSMQEDEPAEVQEVVDVVTTAKLITKVVTAISEIVTAASTIISAAEPQVSAATIVAAPARVAAAPSRRRK